MPSLKVRAFMLSLSVLLTVVDCSWLSGPDESKPSAIMPLAIGNTWVYQSEDSDGTTTFTYTIDRDTTMLGVEWFGNSKSWLLYANISGVGLFECRLTPSNKVNYLICPYPSKVDTQWNYNRSGSSYFLVSVFDTLVTTPAGRFRCIQVLALNNYWGDDVLYTRESYAPGVGRVMLERWPGVGIVGQLPPPTYIEKLVSYSFY